jgi:hypothetical protein
MKRTALLLFAVFLPVIAFAQPANWQALASRIPGGLEERRLRHLEQEWQVEETEPNLLKMTHKMTGMVKYVDITDHSVDLNKLAASPNVQVIDLINVDTTLYNWKYNLTNVVPLSGLVGYPLVIGDLSNNNIINIAGSYKILINSEVAQAAIAEIQFDSTFNIKKIYQDTVIIPLAVTDVDRDGLLELNITDPLLTTGGHAFANYEQFQLDSLPNARQFTHQTWEFGGEVSSETFTNLDGDNNLDIIYEGTDSTEQCCHQIIVAEYDPLINNFRRKFKMIPSPDWRIGGFSVGDFDRDGFQEFVTGSGAGPSHVYLLENTGNDSYEQVYQDTLQTSNAYMTTTTNDIDQNGKVEFFVGGSSYYNGIPVSRIYWFEADGNNTYRKVRNFLMTGTEVLGFTELYNHDVNGDGVDDLVFSFSFSIVMLIWNNATEQFDLFYYDAWENYDQEIHSINIYDLFDAGYKNLIVSVADLAKTPRLKSYLYRFDQPSGIKTSSLIPQDFYLAQNYPNPFNGNTNIRFNLPRRIRISLKIYDTSGKEVMRLINNQIYASGEHTINWDGKTKEGKEVSSGIYLYVLQAGKRREVRKMLFIK